MDNDKIIELETRIAHQEKIIADLSDVVWKLQKQLDVFEDRFKKQMEKITEDPERIASFNIDLDRPPHH
jgi:uncharacterized coiled-coil protein SlyX